MPSCITSCSYDTMVCHIDTPGTGTGFNHLAQLGFEFYAEASAHRTHTVHAVASSRKLCFAAPTCKYPCNADIQSSSCNVSTISPCTAAIHCTASGTSTFCQRHHQCTASGTSAVLPPATVLPAAPPLYWRQHHQCTASGTTNVLPPATHYTLGTHVTPSRV